METPDHLTLVSTQETKKAKRSRSARRRSFMPFLIVLPRRVKETPTDWSAGQRLSATMREKILAEDIAEIEKIRDQLEKGDLISRIKGATLMERRRYRTTGRITPAAQLVLISFSAALLAAAAFVALILPP